MLTSANSDFKIMCQFSVKRFFILKNKKLITYLPIQNLHIDQNQLSGHTESDLIKYILLIATNTIINTIPRAKTKMMAMIKRHAFVIGTITFKGSQDDVVVASFE